MQVAGIHKTSTVDFPGVLSAVLFTPGCNFDCFYCHNRQLLKRESGRLDMEDIYGFLRKRAGMLEGIVISGGEPTMQEGLVAFARELKALGYMVKLDTNGSNPRVIRELMAEGLVDYVAVDYKAPFDRYTEICGQDGGGVRETMRMLADAGLGWEARTTLIPQIGTKDLHSMAAAVPELPKYLLQLYVAQPGHTRSLKTLLPYTPSDIRRMAEGIKAIQPNTDVRV